MTERAFPTVPAFAGLIDLPDWLSLGVSALLALSAIAVAIAPAPGWLAALPPVLAAVLVLFDITRLQPWLYQYMLIFAALASVKWSDLESRATQAALAACAVVVIALYVWSGVQKANMTFAVHVFPWLIAPLGEAWVERLRVFWFVATAFEVSVGALLLVSRTRAWGLAAAVAMHASILLALGPFGRNANVIVWPWNVWMPVIAFILLHRNRQPILRTAWSTRVGRAIVILVGVMPALSFAGRWDDPLSASLYSGTLRDGWIYLTEEGASRVPAIYRSGNPAFAEDASGRYRLDITIWAQSALNVPPYAEPRAYRGIMRKLERAGVPRDQMTLLVRDRPRVTSGTRTYSAVPTR
jgi:hypothetical protein